MPRFPLSVKMLLVLQEERGMKTKLFTTIVKTTALALAMGGVMAPQIVLADQTISAMIPVLGKPQQPRTVLTAPVSTIVDTSVDCERWCLFEGYNNPAVVCFTRGGPSAVGTTLAPGSYILSIGRGTGEGVCTGHIRVTP